MGENTKKILLFAANSENHTAMECCKKLLKMKSMASYHIHVTLVNQSEEFLSDITIIKELNHRLFLHSTDVTCDESVKQTVDDVISTEGKIDVLLCDIEQRCFASSAKSSHILTSLYESNLYPHVRFVTNVIHYMKTRKCGKIIVLNSYGGQQGISYASSYCSARFAVNGFLKSVAAEVLCDGICVSILNTVIRKSPEEFSLHAGVCFDNHQNLSELDRKNILLVEDKLASQKLFKNVSVEKICHGIQSILQTENPDVNFYLNREHEKYAKEKFCDPTGRKTLSDVATFFLNLDIEEFRAESKQKKDNHQKIKTKGVAEDIKKVFHIRT